MAESNKIEKAEELIAGYVLFLSYKDRNLRQMASTSLSKKFDISGRL